MGKSIEDATDLADRIEEALLSASELIPAPPKTDLVKQAAKSAQVDWRLLDILTVDGWGYRYKHTAAWGLEYDQYIHIGPRSVGREVELECKVETNWPAGGSRRPGDAAGTAALYLNAAHTAAQVEIILRDTIGRLKRRHTMVGGAFMALWDEANTILHERYTKRQEDIKPMIDNLREIEAAIAEHTGVT